MKKKQKEETKSIRAIYEGQKTCQDFLKNFNFFFCHFCKFNSDSFGDEVSSSSTSGEENKNTSINSLPSDGKNENSISETNIPMVKKNFEKTIIVIL